MNAKEALKISEAAAKTLDAQRKRVTRAREVAAVNKERQRRLDFEVDLRGRFDWAIKVAVKEGKRSAEVIVVSSADNPGQASALLDEHGYKDIIQSVVREQERNGFKVAGKVLTHSYRTEHESNIPDYDYYEYQKVFEVKWW